MDVSGSVLRVGIKELVKQTSVCTAAPWFGIEHRELKSLTSLRGLAALAVVMQHFSTTAQSYCRTTIPSLVPHGYVGVDFFFVLSGFIMAYTYSAEFQLRGWGAFGPFLAKRIARIVPLNFTVLVLLMIGNTVATLWLGRAFLQTSRPIFDFVANILMLQGLGIGANLNGPSWSVSTEFAAYALFPLFTATLFGSRGVAWLAAVAALVALCALAATKPHLSMASETFPGSLIRCFAEFILGMSAYRLSGQADVRAVLKRDGVSACLAGATVVCLVARTDLPAVLLLPFLVMAFAANDGLMSRLLQWRVFYFLGTVSYSLYLLHNPFRPVALAALKAVTNGPVGAAAALCFAAVGSLFVVPVAWVAYTVVERPGRTVLRGLLQHMEYRKDVVAPRRPGLHG